MRKLLIIALIAIGTQINCSKEVNGVELQINDPIYTQISILIELAKEQENIQMEGIMKTVRGAYTTNREQALLEHIIIFARKELNKIKIERVSNLKINTG